MSRSSSMSVHPLLYTLAVRCAPYPSPRPLAQLLSIVSVLGNMPTAPPAHNERAAGHPTPGWVSGRPNGDPRRSIIQKFVEIIRIISHRLNTLEEEEPPITITPNARFMEVGWWTERVSLTPLWVSKCSHPGCSAHWALCNYSDDVDRHIEYELFRDTNTLA